MDFKLGFSLELSSDSKCASCGSLIPSKSTLDWIQLIIGSIGVILPLVQLIG